MGFEAVLASLARDHHVRHSKFIGEFTRAPVRCGARLAPDRPFQDARFEFWGTRVRLLARIPTLMPGGVLGKERLAPAIDERIVARQLLADLGPDLTCLEQQIRRARRASSARPVWLVG